MSNAPKQSIFQNIAMAIASISNMVCKASETVSKTAQVTDVIADTGLVLANNMQETTVKRSEGNKQRKLKQIDEEFPELV